MKIILLRANKHIQEKNNCLCIHVYKTIHTEGSDEAEICFHINYGIALHIVLKAVVL